MGLRFQRRSKVLVSVAKLKLKDKDRLLTGCLRARLGNTALIPGDLLLSHDREGVVRGG